MIITGLQFGVEGVACFLVFSGVRVVLWCFLVFSGVIWCFLVFSGVLWCLGRFYDVVMVFLWCFCGDYLCFVVILWCLRGEGLRLRDSGCTGVLMFQGLGSKV